MVFKPLYGEPDWGSRPHETPQGADSMPYFSNASYEENRFRAERELGNKIVHYTWTHGERESLEEWASTLSSTVRQKTYLRWSQSPVVEVLAGANETTFRLPRDFLTCRSQPLRATIESQDKESAICTIRLPEVSAETFEQVLIWSMSPQPSLAIEIQMSLAVDVAIFATAHSINSLLHQALDVIWNGLSGFACFEFGSLTPDLLDRIYKHTEKTSLLRELARAILHVIDRPFSFIGTGHEDDDWQSAFENNPDLGFDYFVMRRANRPAVSFKKGGSCQFHRHTVHGIGVTNQSLDPSLCKKFEDGECFEEAHEIKPTGRLQDTPHELGPSLNSPAPSSPASSDADQDAAELSGSQEDLIDDGGEENNEKLSSGSDKS